MSAEGDRIKAELRKEITSAFYLVSRDNDALRARVDALEKQLLETGELALTIGKNAAQISTVRRLAAEPRLQAVVAPGMKLIGRTETGAPIVEPLPPEPPAPGEWKPNPRSEDPMERGLAESHSHDGDRTGRAWAPRRAHEGELDAGSLKLQRELHAGFKK